MRGRSPRSLFAVALVATVTTLWPPPAALASQALSGREVQRLLRLADEAMDSARTLLSREQPRGARARLEEAERDYRRILASNPEQRQAAVGLSGVLFLTRRHEEGVRLLTPLHARLPDDHDITHQLGMQLYRAGRQAEAIGLLEQVAADQGRFDASWLLAVYYYRRAEWAKGLAHAERYAAERPEDTRALALLGTYYLKTGAYARAVDTLDRYLAAHPDNLAARINRANALFRMGTYDRAASAYESLLAEHPKRMRLVYNLAAVRIKQGRCADALPLLDRFIDAEDDDGAARYFKADCLLKLERYTEAQRAFQQAAGGTASNPWIFHGLSHIALAQGHLDEALAHAREAVELAPEDWELITWLGTLLRRAGEPEEALGWHDKAATIEADIARIQVERGRDLWALSRPADALGAFERARQLDPEDADASLGAATALTALAQAARARSDVETARQRLGEALALRADFEPARVNLALIALSADDLAEATKILEASPAAEPGGDHAAVLALIRLRGGDVDGATLAAQRAHERGATLTGLLAEVDAHLAAERDDWEAAARGLDAAYALAPREDLDRARAFAWLQAGLERLGRGDGPAASVALRHAARRRADLSRDDRATLDLASAVLSVMTAAEPRRPTRALMKMLRGRRLRGARWAHVRDIGYTYAAFGYLRDHRPARALEALARVGDRAATGGAAAAMASYARDLQARQAFERRDYDEAARLWSELATRDPADAASRSNLAAARFNLGHVDEAATTWRALVATGAPPEALFNLGNVADRAGEPEEAWRLFRRFVATGAPGAEGVRQRVEAKARVFGLPAKGRQGGGT